MSTTPQTEDTPRPASRIDTATGLASDFLNQFNEAVMLFDCLVGGDDSALDDLLDWRPRPYAVHFRKGRLANRARILHAFRSAAKPTRETLAGAARELATVVSGGAQFMAACRRAGATASIVPIARHLAADARHRLAALDAIVHAGVRPPLAAEVSVLFAHRAA